MMHDMHTAGYSENADADFLAMMIPHHAGAVEMAICAKAIENQAVPPTINLDKPDPECDLDYVPHTAREMKVQAIVNNSFGFGGHNASVVAGRFNG